MDEARKERLEAAGWKIGDFADFADLIGLHDDERQLIELRVDLGIATRRLRESRGLTRKALAKRTETTPSKILKIEEADPEISLDLMYRAFFAAGGNLEDLASRTMQTARDAKGIGSRVITVDPSHEIVLSPNPKRKGAG